MASPSSSYDQDNWPAALMKEELYECGSPDVSYISCATDDVEVSTAVVDETTGNIHIVTTPQDYNTDATVSALTEGGGNASKARGVPPSQEEVDIADAQAIIKMYGSDELREIVKCCKNGCNALIPKEIAVKYRQSLQEMVKDEKDIVVLSLLASHRRLSALAHAYGSFTKRGECRLKDPLKTFKRLDNKYFFADLPICRRMFLFLHDMGKSQFENLVKHYDTNGFVPRVHKSQNRKSNRKNVLSPEDIDRVIVFIKQYANLHGKPVMDRHQKNKNTINIKLPSDVTKRSVWDKYCKTESGRKVARRTFTQLWNKYCPYVTIMNKSLAASVSRPINQISIEPLS